MKIDLRAKYLSLFLLPLFLFQNGFSQEKKSLLWEISGNGLKKPSYLFGTMHVKDEKVFNFSDEFNTAFDNADAIALELDLSKVDKSGLLSMMLLSGDTTLSTLYTEKELKKIDKFVQSKLGSSIEVYGKFKPFFIVTLISQAQFKQDKTEALDEYIMKTAQKSGKEIIGLETVEEQTGALASMTIEDQKKSLLDAAKHPNKDSKQMEKLTAAYIDADFEKLEKMQNQWEVDDEFKDELLKNRNLKMMERLLPHLSKKSVFTAVGALHLIGKDGLIELLRAKGYTLKPM